MLMECAKGRRSRDLESRDKLLSSLACGRRCASSQLVADVADVRDNTAQDKRLLRGR